MLLVKLPHSIMSCLLKTEEEKFTLIPQHEDPCFRYCIHTNPYMIPYPVKLTT